MRAVWEVKALGEHLPGTLDPCPLPHSLGRLLEKRGLGLGDPSGRKQQDEKQSQITFPANVIFAILLHNNDP